MKHDTSEASGLAPLEVSEAALAKISEALKEEPEGRVFRTAIEGGGCSGMRYVFSVEELEEGDILVGSEEAPVAVDSASARLLAGCRLDYVEELIGSSFRVVNPRASSSCGCGTSFMMASEV